MSPPTADFERSLNIGNIVGGCYFGLQTYMCLLSWYLLHRSKGMNPQIKNFYIIFGLSMLILSIFAWLANDFAGGPFAYYYVVAHSAWFSMLGTVVSVFQGFMTDALLLYRCYIVWNCNLRIIALPVLIYLVSIDLAILSILQSLFPNSIFFAKATATFAVPWLSLTSGLNFILTALIAGRILYMGHKHGRIVSERTGRSVVPYTGVVAIIVESALPLSIVGIVFAIFLNKGSAPTRTVFFGVTYGAFVALAPQLIILRAARGRAWTRDTLTQVPLTPMVFGGMHGSSTFARDVQSAGGQDHDGDGSTVDLTANTSQNNPDKQETSFIH